MLPNPRPLYSSSATADKDKVIDTAGIWDKATGEIEYIFSPRLLGSEIDERNFDGARSDVVAKRAGEAGLRMWI